MSYNYTVTKTTPSVSINAPNAKKPSSATSQATSETPRLSANWCGTQSTPSTPTKTNPNWCGTVTTGRAATNSSNNNVGAPAKRASVVEFQKRFAQQRAANATTSPPLAGRFDPNQSLPLRGRNRSVGNNSSSTNNSNEPGSNAGSSEPGNNTGGAGNTGNTRNRLPGGRNQFLPPSEFPTNPNPTGRVPGGRNQFLPPSNFNNNGKLGNRNAWY